MDNTNMNKIMADIIFGIDKAQAQFEYLEKAAAESAKKIEQTFKNVSPDKASATTVATQQAKSEAVLAKSQERQNAIVSRGGTQRVAATAKSEAQISQIQAKEALTRQQIAEREAKTQLAILQQQQAQEKLLYMQARRQIFDDKPQGFAGLMERRASWLATGAVVMGGMAGLAETLSTIKDVEFGMTTIARVTEDVTFNFKGMRDELQQLGITYGNTWGNVSDIAIRWAQAGYNMADTVELTKSSLLALNTAELNSEQATSGLIAIMAQWGLTANDLLPTIDKINKVACAA